MPWITNLADKGHDWRKAGQNKVMTWSYRNRINFFLKLNRNPMIAQHSWCTPPFHLSHPNSMVTSSLFSLFLYIEANVFLLHSAIIFLEFKNLLNKLVTLPNTSKLQQDSSWSYRFPHPHLLHSLLYFYYCNLAKEFTINSTTRVIMFS